MRLISLHSPTCLRFARADLVPGPGLSGINKKTIIDNTDPKHRTQRQDSQSRLGTPTSYVKGGLDRNSSTSHKN